MVGFDQRDPLPFWNILVLFSKERLDGSFAESGRKGVAVRDAVFGLVSEKGWLLREMAVPRLTLEEVFIRLTQAASPRGDTPVEEVAVGVSVAASSDSESGRSSP